MEKRNSADLDGSSMKRDAKRDAPWPTETLNYGPTPRPPPGRGMGEADKISQKDPGSPLGQAGCEPRCVQDSTAPSGVHPEPQANHTGV